MENRLFEMHHKIKLKLDAICQEAGDMDVEEFMKVYRVLKEAKAMKRPSIERRLQEDAIDDMDLGEY